MKVEDDTLNFTRMFRKGKGLGRIDHYGRIIVSGMGGSGISGDIASAMCNSLQVPSVDPETDNHPVIAWKNYGLPSWANSKDCVICISYSGNTAETLSAASKAIELGCKLEVITTGGKLEKLASKNNCSITKVEKGHQPRAALPLLLTPLLYKLGIPNLDAQIEEVRKLPIMKERAQEIAEELKGRLPCIYANGVMMPVAYRWRCQIEENAKQMALHHEIPEMNHNEIVGLENRAPNSITVVLIRDNQENEITRKRFTATRRAVLRLRMKSYSDLKIVDVSAEGESPLARMMSCVLLGDLVSLKLAEMNKVDPGPVEVIEDLKTELSRLDGK